MFDFFTCIISFFILGVLVLIIWIGVRFLHSLVTAGQANNSYNEESQKQLRKNSIEDSQGDGLMCIDEGDDYSDILFPEELDDD